tara:strand:+ start:1250 stop:1903 length:654 start_codon:yes stop_codon:yes gene_type:complete
MKPGDEAFTYFNDPTFPIGKYIDPDEVKNILELGARDGEESVRLSQYYNANVYAFECNPNILELCSNTIEGHENVELIKKAVWHENTEITFHPVINGNYGASSCFKSNNSYPYESPFQQTEVKVEAIKLSDWLDDRNLSIDLLCVDLQGAEKNALLGMGEHLNDVKYIITEGQTKPIYHESSMLSEITEILNNYNFILKESKIVNEYFGDFFFIKEI